MHAPLDVDAYDYAYPPEAVAQVPAARREDARLLGVTRFALESEPPRAPVGPEGTVADLPSLLAPGDLVVVNDVAVSPARLAGEREGTGGRVTALALAVDGPRATALLGTRGRLESGERVVLAGEAFVLERSLGEGRWELVTASGRDVSDLLADAGRMPLPPYIDRGATSDPRDDLDRERYRTTFARGEARAVAAPTAGLHLTPELFDALEARGVQVERLRLDVGEGTFRPLRGEQVDEHTMHVETYEVPGATAAAFAAARERGAAVVAVGTTVTRTLESAVAEDGRSLRVGPGRTDLFLKPGAAFRAVDALLTNFHQPRSTLLVLVSAFAGYDTTRAAYEHAVSSGYRLFSYGDAMLLRTAEHADRAARETP